MGLKELVVAQVIDNLLHSPDVNKAVMEAAEVTDKFLDEKLHGASERAQKTVIKDIFFPFSRVLMKEDVEAYKKLLQDELALLK